MKYISRLCLIVLIGFILGGCNRLDNHQPLSSARLSFVKANEISQTFLSHHSSLNMVHICLRNPGRSLIPLVFELKDKTGALVRRLDITGGNIDNDDCTRFQFEPITDSQNQSYTASIKNNLDPRIDPADETLLRLNVGIEAHGGGDYLAGEASVDGVETPYDLHFKTFYQQDLKDVIIESIHNFLTRLTKDPLFFLIFVIFLIGIIWKYRQIK